jgi:large subunit ribosomal protein L13
MRTYSPKKGQVERKWFVVDAKDQVLGRLASKVAYILRGKHKPIFAPHVDTGDHVIVVNASKVRLTGNKLTQKFHYHYTGYPSGLRAIRYDELLKRHPDRVVALAVKRMLPKNRLARKILKKLKVYAGSEHPHQAQKPEALDLKAVNEKPGG